MPYEPTPEQTEVLQHDYHRHARVLAGPGTGKSATLVALVDRLLGQTEAPPHIKLLTFTRAATAELAKKVSTHPAAAAEHPSTIHSFSISVLLRNPGAGGFPTPLRIADDWEYHEIIRPTLAHRAHVDLRRLDDLVREMASNWDSLRPDENPRIDAQARARFNGAWAEHRHVYGYTLPAELPYALLQALRDHPDLEGVDFDLLIVDEYQDLNACDLAVLRGIAERGCSIIGAGDDDQSIYSFRRAAPEGIRTFADSYPGSADYSLSITQRCGNRIIEWASYVIQGDPTRPHDRPPLRAAPGSPPGEVALLSFRGDVSEANGVADLAQWLINEKDVPANEILVLLRTDYNGTFSSPIKAALEERGIAYSDPDAIDRLLAEEANRKMLAAFRLLVNPSDSLALATLLRLTRGIGPNFATYIYDRATAARIQFGDALLDGYRQAFPDGAQVSSRSATELIQGMYLWLQAHEAPEEPPEQGWGHWIVATAGGDVVPTPTDPLAELLHALDERVEPGRGLGAYLSQVNPLGKDYALAESPGVRIMTMIGAKGLTVRATIIAGLEEGLVPRPQGNLQEERRMLYVAMTRAREFLYGTWARRRRGPTARAGAPRVNQRRTLTNFLNGGPVESRDGQGYLEQH